MSRSTPSARPWLEVTSRTLLAIIGGYVLTYAFTAALARLLPLPGADATIIATLLSFIIYLTLILWSFSGIALRRLGLVMSIGTLFLAAIGFGPQLLERMA